MTPRVEKEIRPIQIQFNKTKQAVAQTKLKITAKYLGTTTENKLKLTQSNFNICSKIKNFIYKFYLLRHYLSKKSADTILYKFGKICDQLCDYSMEDYTTELKSN